MNQARWIYVGGNIFECSKCKNPKTTTAPDSIKWCEKCGSTMLGPEIKCYFKFIIPTYDRRSVEIAKSCILNQTFKNVHVVVVHDGAAEDLSSLDYTVDNHLIDRYTDVYCEYRRYNGGTRNAGLDYSGIQSKYTMFLDDDDFLSDSTILDHLYDFIQEAGEPDMIRLPYMRYYVDDRRTVTKSLSDNIDLPSTCRSGKTAPWTKCIKSELVVSFPENTMFEDVVQHIHQCDKCETFAYFPEPVVVWNIHKKQAYKGGNPKWESSKYRFIADLIDLKLDHDWAIEMRDKKVEMAIEALCKDNLINR